VSRGISVPASEPRIFRALAAVSVASLLPGAGRPGTRVARLAIDLLRIPTGDAPFVVLLRHGFVIVASDPLREVRMARALSRLRVETGITVAPAAPAAVSAASVVTASLQLAAGGLVPRLVALAAWPLIRRPVSASLERWLAAVGVQALT
jgi:hypothetical protein